MTHPSHVYRTNPAERQRLQDDLHLLPPAVAGRVQLLLADFVTALAERRQLIERVCWLESDNESLRKQIGTTTDATFRDLYAADERRTSP